jgi:NAD(P)H dehydrogenase (quinone)
LRIAGEHEATEKLIRDCGIPYTILRYGWCIENCTDHLALPLARRGFFGSAGDGRIAGASRTDYAAAAVTVLTTEGHRGKTYELAGDHAFTMKEFADAVSAWAGKSLPYKHLPASEQRRILAAEAVPEMVVELLVATDRAIARGDLDSSSPDLHRLIGRDTQTLVQVIARLPKTWWKGAWPSPT